MDASTRIRTVKVLSNDWGLYKKGPTKYEHDEFYARPGATFEEKFANWRGYRNDLDTGKSSLRTDTQWMLDKYVHGETHHTLNTVPVRLDVLRTVEHLIKRWEQEGYDNECAVQSQAAVHEPQAVVRADQGQ